MSDNTLTIDKEKYIDGVRRLLMDRYANGVVRSEADFIAGAATIFALLERMDVPPPWIFGPMGGRPVYGTDDHKEIFDESGKLDQITKEMYFNAHKPLKGHAVSDDDVRTLKTASHAFVRECDDETIEEYLGISKKEAQEEIESAWNRIS